MNFELKSLILQDYKKAFDRINKIISKKDINCFVLKPNQYLTPTIIRTPLSLNDGDSEFVHYNLICETLEKLLAGEQTKYTCHFSDASEEIKKMLVGN